LIEARAIFERQRGHLTEAQPFYARAVELGSRNPRLYREYAAIVEGIDVGHAERLLSTAVANEPSDLTTRLRLASVQLRQRKATDALETLKPVTRVSAEDAFVLFQLLANAYAQTDRFAEAREAAGLALKHAQRSDQQEYARGLVKSRDDHANRLAEAEARRAAAAAEAAAVADAAAKTPPPPPPPPPTNPTAPPPSTSRGGRATPSSPPPVRMIPVGGRAPRAAAGPQTVDQGRITNVECGAGGPIVEITTTKAAVLRLSIDDQYGIRIVGKPGRPPTCSAARKAFQSESASKRSWTPPARPPGSCGCWTST
jgi:tetratricopeptide (TPR) repeat protein